MFLVKSVSIAYKLHEICVTLNISSVTYSPTPPPIYQAQQINHHKYKSRASKREEASVERRGTQRRPKELHGLWPAKQTYKVKGLSIFQKHDYTFWLFAV